MKNSRNITSFISILAVGIFAALMLRAQETAMPVQEGAISLTDTNVDWNSMSDLEVELKAIESVPPMPADSLPEAGTFWSAQHAPGTAEEWPPLPTSFGMGAWSLGDDGVFLLSDLNHVYGQPKKSKSATTSLAGGMMMDAMDSGAGGDGSDSGDGGVPPVNTPNYGTNLWLSIAGISNSFANLFLENTAPDIQYEIQSKQDLTVTGWVSEGFVLGSELTNWTPMNVAQNGRTNLFFRIRSWADDGSGLPIWWQLQYFGTTGVDPNADPEGDGWSNIQKFQNGMNPNVFYTPPAPQGLTVNFNANTGSVGLNWLPSPGPVTGYTIERDGDVTTNINVSSSATSFDDDTTLSDFDEYLDLTGPIIYGDYRIQAHYAGGNSAWSDYVPLESGTLANVPVAASFIPGPQNTVYLATGALPTGTTKLRLTREILDELGDVLALTNIDVPLTSFTNGLYALPSAWTAPVTNVDYFADYQWWAQAETDSTNASAAIQLGYQSGLPYTSSANFNALWLEPPYFDGRAQLKQNLIFLLRAATVDNAFGYYTDSGSGVSIPRTFSSNYAESSFYQNFAYDSTDAAYLLENPPFLNVFQPFQDNYFYANCAFDSSRLHQGLLATGIYPPGFWPSDDYLLMSNTLAYTFTAPLTNGVSITALGADQAQWLATGQHFWNDLDLSAIGINHSSTGNTNTMLTNARNIFGLQFLSTEIAWANGSGSSTLTLNPGYSTTQGGYYYTETAQPGLQTVGYDFWNSSPLPEATNFSTSQTSDLMIAPVGNSIQIAGYAKMAVTNGYSGAYGYLGQYFDTAYEITNGIVTTNTTGVLSPYGNFFATQPGPTALVTMPDVDTGARGTCTVYCVSLALDRNHDGNMDTSFSGADATSANSPYTHWCNNNYDRFALDEDDGTNYQDDVLVQNCPYTPNTATPDYNYRDMFGNRVIPDTRDLEDYARLWVCGVASNLLAALPTGSTVTLNWGDVGSPNASNPTIDLFQATDADGGIEYLTNETSAANQIDPAQSAYVGRLAPGGSVQLNASFFSGWAGNHFIWCGVTNGSGQLNLTIADASGNVLAQASQWIQIVDIKQMYERWTVGDNLTNTPATTASLATENLPPLASAFQYTLPQDTNTPYILFVHGWNMETWEKDRFAETAFKRLYWQGYQGRFGEFRWPTGSGFTGNFGQLVTDPQEKDNFDNSEYNAWLSGTGLLNKLNDLNAEYPGHVYVLAHSMGNVVAGEALRLAGTTQVVNTYVASQAAVTAHAYDETVPNYSFDVTVGGVNFNLGPNTPNIYGNWLTNNNGGGAGQIISFYNTNDFALSQLHWQLDQLFKPDTLVAEGGSLWNYRYSGSTNDASPWNHFFKTNTVSTTVNFDIVGSLANRYEVMSYAAQSYTTALGATPGVHHVAANVDLTTLWPSPDPLDNDYASHFYHSAEFRGDSVWEWKYWNTLLFSASSGFNISNP